MALKKVNELGCSSFDSNREVQTSSLGKLSTFMDATRDLVQSSELVVPLWVCVTAYIQAPYAFVLSSANTGILVKVLNGTNLKILIWPTNSSWRRIYSHWTNTACGTVSSECNFNAHKPCIKILHFAVTGLSTSSGSKKLAMCDNMVHLVAFVDFPCWL